VCLVDVFSFVFSEHVFGCSEIALKNSFLVVLKTTSVWLLFSITFVFF
jgi:hypothetical protein